MKSLFNRATKGGSSSQLGPGTPPKRIVSLGMVARNFRSKDSLDRKSRRTMTFLKVGGVIAGFAIFAGLFLPGSSGSIPDYSGLAEVYLNSYLTGDPTILPVSADIKEEWERIQEHETERDSLHVEFLESFSATASAGYTFVVYEGIRAYKATIVLSSDASNMIFMAEMPYLEPYFFNTSELPSISVGEMVSLSRETTLIERIDKWADYYFSSNNTSLYEMTGTDLEMVFYGVEGFTYSKGSASIQAAGVHPEGVIVRVAFQVAENNDPAFFRQVSMDLLIVGEANQSADIVAWGSAGTGPALISFGNGSLEILHPVRATDDEDTFLTELTPAEEVQETEEEVQE